jgi:hypothetical protein
VESAFSVDSPGSIDVSLRIVTGLFVPPLEE